jgi:hypothetical protein
VAAVNLLPSLCQGGPAIEKQAKLGDWSLIVRVANTSRGLQWPQHFIGFLNGSVVDSNAVRIYSTCLL